jgi:hypothetical protein
VAVWIIFKTRARRSGYFHEPHLAEQRRKTVTRLPLTLLGSGAPGSRCHTFDVLQENNKLIAKGLDAILCP